MGAIAARETEGNEIALEAGEPADIGMRADAHILMHDARAADRRMIADAAHGRRAAPDWRAPRPSPSRQSWPTCGIGEKGAIIADARLAAAGRRAGVDRHALANDAAGADDERARARRTISNPAPRRRARRRDGFAHPRRCVCAPRRPHARGARRPRRARPAAPTWQNGPMTDALAEARAAPRRRRMDECAGSNHSALRARDREP